MNTENPIESLIAHINNSEQEFQAALEEMTYRLEAIQNLFDQLEQTVRNLRNEG